MRVEEWERVKTLFEAALGVSPENREAFLRSRSSDSEELVLAVLSLLRNHSDSLVTTQPRPMTLAFAPGDLVAARFRIVRHVNSGGMGDVYEAFDERLSYPVALKAMRPELLENTDAVARFQREVRIARGVAHPNLCRLYEFLEERSADGRTIPCLTMEFVNGETLSSRLHRDRPLTAEEALPIIRQIAAGLGHLHEHGILHRDLKPSNVMLQQRPGESLRVLVMDFGLAKIAKGEVDLFESSLHFQAGAPYFMSPEQLRGERPTTASDIYAFGLLIDEIVTRSPAYPAESAQALYYAKLWEQPLSPRLRSRNLPDHWAAAILQCLSQRPAERPPSALIITRLLERRPAWPLRLIAPVRSILKSIRPRTYAVVSVALTILALVRVLSAPLLTVEMLEIANTTGDASYNYLCGGLAGEVARRFAEVGDLNAIVRHPSRFGQAKPLGRFTIDGVLDHRDSQVALTVGLHDSHRPGAPWWSRRFTAAQISDPLQLEREIVEGTISGLQHASPWSTLPLRLRAVPGVRLVASVLRPASAAAEHKSVSPKNNRALDDFMRGKQMIEQMSPEKVTTGIGLLQRAIAEDPSFALSYTALANANFTLLNWNQAPPERLLSDARVFAQTAVTLDPNLAEAYEARALVSQHEWDWGHAREDYQRALKLKPSFALARRHYAVLLTQVGEMEEGLREVRQAREDDPYDESAIPGLGLILYIGGHAEEAVRVLESPAAAGMAAACHNLGESYAVLGLRSSGARRAEYFRKAILQADRLRQLESRPGRAVSDMKPDSDRLFAQFYSLAGDRVRAAPYLTLVRKELDLGLVSLPEAAWVYAAAGNKDEALTLLELAVASKDRHLLFIKVYPFVDPLRNEPRFHTILAQMRL